MKKPKKNSRAFKNSAWVVAVDMGYGHQRTAFPLKDCAFGKKVINANNYDAISLKDRKIWNSTRVFYEFISDFKKIPLIGNFVFYLFDKFQQIPAFYPERDLSKPTISLRKIFSLIKQGWGKDLILKLSKNPYPLIATFFTPAFMAEFFHYPGKIYCVICDADVSRAWAPPNPKRSKIIYFAPNSWVVDRLALYGVKKKNIFLTGYPLPQEIIGTEKMEILKRDVASRLLNLDPEKKYLKMYEPLIKKYVGKLPSKPNHPLTVLFSIGGAGAQKEIVASFLKSLSLRIRKQEIKVIISAGTKEKVRDYFLKKIKKIGLVGELSRGIELVFDEKTDSYFAKFNQALKKTDILWTKPSELSFYAALGIPIIVAPSIGSQEDLNRKWLLKIGAGVIQENPNYADQWIYDYLKSGRFAEAAMEGLVEIEKMGTFNIKKICSGALLK
jgi:UDP-N-acetylglucosamine:LPS N-acetylglucosamine transferase